MRSSSEREDLRRFVDILKIRFLVEQAEMDFGEGKLGLLARYEFFKQMENVINYYINTKDDDEILDILANRVMGIDFDVLSKMWTIMILENILDKKPKEMIERAYDIVVATIP